jgi:hypothetical protein
MSQRKSKTSHGAMLDLWRPPQGAGEPIGCLTTTYTFTPGLFDEQCLARYLEIESEPNREDLAFLLERESRLGSVYAGVLVDYTQAGVEHSLRWDVLPVRIRGGKQHAKVSLLAWTRHIRIIVASANLSEPGYRTNYEVAAAVDLTIGDANLRLLADSLAFLRSLLSLVPGATEHPPEIIRAEHFLNQVEQQAQHWRPSRHSGPVRHQLTCTLPAMGESTARSSLEEAVLTCRGRGGSPDEVWVASPFFDLDDESSRVTAALCKLMARSRQRKLWFCVPAVHDGNQSTIPRLAAPKALVRTPQAYQGTVSVEILPEQDENKNRRPWHAKMLALLADHYSALMIGSSNFTCAGMGVEHRRNAEANLLFIADRVDFGREVGNLEAVWPEMVHVTDPESAEWLGAQPSQEEEEQAVGPLLPAGFLSATFRAGDMRWIFMRLDPTQLPDDWQIQACGHVNQRLLSAATWREQRQPSFVEISWAPIQPPEKLVVQWADQEAFMPLNVEDSRALPPPAQLDDMSADDMLLILAASDPSSAFRAWARGRQPLDSLDAELDSAAPIDLDPLRRYDLRATFLHRIRRRAGVLAQLRANLERPVWSKQALEWRLRGLIGIEPLAERLLRDLATANGAADEALLTLADFLIVLREVEYEASDDSLSAPEFERTFQSFLSELATKLQQQVEPHRDRVAADLWQFWDKVLDQCRR